MENQNKTYYLELAWILAILFFVFLFFKIAWVAEDAYISFRVLEQFFDGNGLRWNPHERVQVFTHPLWMMVLIVFRLFSKDVFLNTLIVSFLLCLGTLFILPRIVSSKICAIMAVFHLCLSKAFMDYTTSGLENPLSYFLVACFIFLYFKEDFFKKNFVWLTLIVGLSITNRHDLGVLFLIPWSFCAWIFFKSEGFKALVIKCLIGFSPFIIWTFFSVVYYGFPFPNTAYAKLYTSIPSIDLFYQGMLYFRDSISRDPVLVFTLLGAGGILIFSKEKKYVFLGLGLFLHIFYIMKIGGDFMSGRFLTPLFLISVVTIWNFLNRDFSLIFNTNLYKTLGASLVIYLCYSLLIPQSPLLTQVTGGLGPYGVADERGFYINASTLKVYLSKRPNEIFPVFFWSNDGIKFKNSTENVVIHGNIGFFGYYAGTQKIIVDALALSDPLLARLPAEKPWRIGHFKRTIPEGYIESVKTGENLITDPEIHQLYYKIKIVTSGPLFSKERWKYILELNL